MMKTIKHPWLIALTIIYTIIIAYTFVNMEDNVYYWDYNGYWRVWEDFTQAFLSDPLHSLASLKHSIRHDDYNKSPIVIIGLFKLLPIASRNAYILGLAITYLIPTFICFSLLARKMVNSDRSIIPLLSYLIPFSFIAFWAPTLRGYPDVCGLIFIILSVTYCLKHDLTEKFSVSQALKLGALIWAPFLLRRWYAYTVVSLYLTLPLLQIFYHKGRLSLASLKNVIANFFIAGLTSVLLALICQWPLLKRIITTNYSYIYSAYQSSFSYSVETVINNVGALFVGVVILSALLTLIIGSFKQRVLLCFFALNLVISFILFTSTQSPGIQHDLPFSLWLLLMFCQGLFLLLSRCKSQSAMWCIAGGIFALLIFTQLHSLFGLANNSRLSPYLAVPTLPLKVENYSEYSALSNDVMNLTENGKRVAILSSSGILNDDMLNTVSGFKLEKHINYASQVDLRDNFREDTLMSDYVVVTDPIQIHLNESGQRVITVPAGDILNHIAIGQAYTRLPREYKLSSHAHAWIYKKTRSFTATEVSDFYQQLFSYYPEWKAQYSASLFRAYLTANISLGDVWGAFSIDDENNIFAHPGENTPTTIQWQLDGVKVLSVKSTGTTCNTDDHVKVKLSADGVVTKTFDIAKGATQHIDMSSFQGKTSTLQVAKEKSSGCDGLQITASQ